MKKFDRITVDPDKMGGIPCIRNLRMPVATIINMFAAGMNAEKIIKEHPELDELDIKQALEYAAEALMVKDFPIAM
ncbi:MAG: DUF433 domain-containing protein [Melioribacteraceae bacterium]|nr:DUF433 domain-containing protein [Melioribacteraceae bacterium]MCF8355283.1 DUF433 domain-containing protein [Melioribacteraceae bacterium]MCF8394129.1 DUF433 domain-containing protein [Melioribacteraceae bacterium]MCF8418132.1 DUF433 domain-containing protein [Melioribacteraceae bacterium]